MHASTTFVGMRQCTMHNSMKLYTYSNNKTTTKTTINSFYGLFTRPTWESFLSSFIAYSTGALLCPQYVAIHLE